MVEILLLAAVAIFIFARLFSTIGKQKGAPPPAFRRNEQAEQRPQPVHVVRNPDEVDEEDDSISGIGQISRIDPSFNQREFLQGARGAYEMIVKAFADGDRSSLKNLLNDDIYQDYDSALKQREESGEEPLELMRLKNAAIESGDVRGSMAEVTVLFEAELTNGDRISDTKELWTFERDTKSRNPNWKLSDVSAA